LTGEKKLMAEPCTPATSSTELAINNVRTIIHTGGDMWWDLKSKAMYYVPGNAKTTSMFASALWIAGTDVNGQLKVAAQRFRSSGNDYWTGPLTTDGTASIDATVCKKYDKHFVITRAEVEQFINTGKATRVIREWPAHGDVSLGQDYYLSPFYDKNGDGQYNPDDGDYPKYETKEVEEMLKGKYGRNCVHNMERDDMLFGDQTIYWIFNDKGNIHTESGGQPIGLEFHAQAFAFATNDELNNMTFYSYKIINRSTYRLKDTYFSQWTDCDLGYAFDDYVGCDVKRGLGYCYNGKPVDGTGKDEHYGENPPAVGVDFFQGPYMDPDGLDNPIILSDGKDEMAVRSVNGVNFGDGEVDNERFGMRRFVYYNNTSVGPQGEPTSASDYYNYLRGIWKDGTKMRYGGNGHVQSGANGPEADFMFPGDSDPIGWGTKGQPQPKWTEVTAGNSPGDRRFMQSAGPFTLEPGSVNFITVGIPWARASSGGPEASVALLRVVDDKCQRLFDNCFKVVNGPDAPDLSIQELDKELILTISNENPQSNNYHETYQEYDFNIISPDTLTPDKRYDSIYRFEGYQIYQVIDKNVSVSELSNPEKARLVAQCDKKNGIKRLVNYYMDLSLGALVPREEVNGEDKGLRHTFTITEDAFTKSRLVNYKKYYYIAIAYAYNNYLTFSTDPSYTNGLYGQKEPYKAGRKAADGGSIKPVMAVPHNTDVENNGTIIKANYGFGPMITRIEGQGNGGVALDLTNESINTILRDGKILEPTYKNGAGPVDIKVVDPLNVVGGSFVMKFIPNSSSPDNMDKMTWVIYNVNTGETYSSYHAINVQDERIIPELGLSVNVYQSLDVATQNNVVNEDGFISATIKYGDSTKIWYTAIPDYDSDPTSFANWIRSGIYKKENATDDEKQYNDYYYDTIEVIDETHYTNVSRFLDEKQVYEKVLGGTWAPYRLCSYSENGPAYGNAEFKNFSKKNALRNLASIDFVITSDKSKWTRCPVIEMCESKNSSLAEGGVKKFGLRAGKAVDKDGNPTTSDTIGMGWFPGYAINVETGERLNMMFGEDSWLVSDNGRDMKWNPTSNYYGDVNGVIFGGKHYVYIMGHNGDGPNDCPAYDGGQWLYSKLRSGTDLNKGYVYKDVMWVTMPMLVHGRKLLETDITIKIRVSKPYKKYFSTDKSASYKTNPENNHYPMYRFSTYDIATEYNVFEVKKDAMDNIGIVPNPYNAYSSYETNQLDNRVRIINLPPRCEVQIYTLGGNLIRKLTKSDSNTYLDWDMKNYAGIPVSSGVYLFHIYSYPGSGREGEGHKILKWFCTMRPMDLNSY